MKGYTVKYRLKNNRITYFLIEQKKNLIRYYIPMVIFNVRKYCRIYLLHKYSSYNKLLKIKNKHIGKRCFIVATGPSLQIADLEKLKNEITISMNSICLALEETDWMPTYYGIQDMSVYGPLEKQIDKLNVECMFISDHISKNIPQKENHYIFPLNMLDHNLPNRMYKSKFSDDPFKVIYSGFSITYSLIQIAVYMGFKEIYLLGVDCNYSNNMNHHFKEYDLVDSNFSSLGKKMIIGYKEAKKYADHNNIKIFNATRGGMLEVFERVDLDTIL